MNRKTKAAFAVLALIAVAVLVPGFITVASLGIGALAIGAVLTEGNYLGDWLVQEFGAPNHCREEMTVLVPANTPSGTVLGTESVFSKTVPYDNSDPAAATGILINAVEVADQQPVTSIVDLTNTATVTTPTPHGLITGDIVSVSGATVDADLNGSYSVTVTSPTVFTITTANVTDATYTEATLRLTKLNHNAVVLVRGPATVAKGGLNWGASDATGITAGLADLALLGIVDRESV